MTDRLAWTLIHFIWQGAAIAALYAILRARLKRPTPNASYTLACTALALMLAAPVATLLLTSHVATGSHPAPHVNPAQLSVYGSSLYSNLMNPEATNPSEPWLAWVVMFWLAGTLSFTLRLLASWILTLRLRTVSARPAPPEWQQTLDHLRQRISISRPIRLLVSALVEVPGVIGHLRPVILVPIGLLGGLPPDHIEALLIHELAHIRRHDYLVNILQGLAEALLFYHPAVWWISGHIRAEREHCCDDIAVAATGDMVAYVRALADLACSSAPLRNPAVAATDGSLSARIARLTGEPYRHLRRRNPGSFAIPVALILIGTALAILAQTPERPKFEVASIKEDINFSGKMNGIGSPSPGTFRARDIPLRWLIRGAYNVNSFNIFGAPRWLDSAGFDIDAKTPVIPGESRREELARMNVMLQTLLEDRMKLKLHVEQREMPLYVLTVSKNGLKMKHAPCDPREPACPPQLAEARKTWAQPINGTWATIPDFLVGLATMTGGQRAIVDRTGLSGVWDTHMQFRYVPPPKPGPTADGAEPPEPSESIFTAIEEQLGLHLEAGRAPFDVLVVDKAEKPDPN